MQRQHSALVSGARCQKQCPEGQGGDGGVQRLHGTMSCRGPLHAAGSMLKTMAMSVSKCCPSSILTCSQCLSHILPRGMPCICCRCMCAPSVVASFSNQVLARSPLVLSTLGQALAERDQGV